MKPFQFFKAGAGTQAVKEKKQTSRFIAGGSNLVDLMKKHIEQPDELIDITSTVSASIEKKSNGIRIGAMARNSSVASDPDVLTAYPLLSKAILAGASPQIRNMASTGGNLLQRTRCPYFYDITLPCNKRNPGSGCGALKGDNRMSAIVGWSDTCVAVHPSDMCVAMAALDANVNIIKKDGQAISIPFKDFHRLPGTTPEKDNNLPADALITSIDIAANSFAKNCSYLKVRDRDSYAFALISVAAALQLQGTTIVSARLASGGVAHKPWRWYSAEQFLKGKQATKEIFSEAAALAVKEIKTLPDNKYKAMMLPGAIEVALQNCLQA